ncbi:MAG: nucleotidyltransferase family protein [Bacteroidaceae bacterium]|nr:nucleotidyltransferase family protein [Bacteroidaceae bacterium]
MERVGLFLSLLRSSVWGMSIDLHDQSWTHEQFHSIISLAKEQAVAGLVAQALVDSGVKLERKDISTICGILNRTQQYNSVLNQAVAGLCKGMNRRNIRIYVFKGQTLATLYPNGGLRQGGDIDFGCHPDDWETCLSVFKNNKKLNIIENTTEKHVSFNVSGVEFELHRKLTAFASPRHRRYWAEIVMPEILNTLSSVNINGYDVPTLNPTYNALYVFVHIFYHLIDEGVGLRQFCDWAMLLNAMENGGCIMDKALLEKHLKGLGLMKAYTGLGAILTDYLGLPEEKFPFIISPKEHKQASKLFKNIIEMGNFGHNKQYIRHSGVIHGIQHLGRITMQARRFYAYAPSEALWRVPYMFNWWLTKLRRKVSQ